MHIFLQSFSSNPLQAGRKPMLRSEVRQTVRGLLQFKQLSPLHNGRFWNMDKLYPSQIFHPNFNPSRGVICFIIQNFQAVHFKETQTVIIKVFLKLYDVYAWSHACTCVRIFKSAPQDPWHLQESYYWHLESQKYKRESIKMPSHFDDIGHPPSSGS